MQENDNSENTVEAKQNKKSLTKRIFKILLYLVLSLIGLNVFLYVLLSIPAVQQKAGDFAVGELKKILGTEISIEELRLSLFNRVSLKGVYIEDLNKDTLLYANEVDVKLGPWELIKNNKLAITGVSLNNFLINVNKKDSTGNFNFQFVVDAFSSESDTTKKEESKSSLVVVIEDINLRDGRLNYAILADTLIPGIFNASHISLSSLQANVYLNSINPDRFDIALNNLSVQEGSGLEIKNLKGHLYSNNSQIWVEGLSLNLPHSHLRASNIKYNLQSGQYALETNEIDIAPKDLVAFLPNLKFLTENIKISTSARGTLPEINVDSLNIAYGKDFIIKSKAHLADYEKYGDSDINLSIDQFKATPSAITSFIRLGDSTFVASDIINSLGDVYLKGKVQGQLKNFKVNTEAWSRQGLVKLSAAGNVDTTFTNFNITAGLHTQNFNLRKLLGDDFTLGRLTAHFNMKARQSAKEPLNAVIQGKIDSLGVDKETVTNLPIQAYYNATKMGVSASADWKIGKLNIDASMTQAATPDVHLRVDADSVHIDRFYKNDNWINPRLSFVLNGDIKGLDIDNMTGFVNIDSLDFHDDIFNFKPGKFTLKTGKKDDENKFIEFASSLLNANISGQYTFKTLADEVSDMMHNYLPDVFMPERKAGKKKKKEANDFTFNISANNTEKLGAIFSLPVNIVLPATINGHISTIDKTIKIDGDLPHIKFGNYDIQNTSISIANADSAFNAIAGSKVSIDNGDYNLALNINGEQNSIHTLLRLFSDNTQVDINGQIEVRSEFNRNEEKELVSTLKITPSDIKVGKLALNLLPAEIQNVGSRTEVRNFGIGVNKKRYFGAEGVISDQETDSLVAYFDHAEMGVLLEAFNVKNIQGCIHGDVILTNLLKQPELYTNNFEIADIVLYNDTLGTLALDSEWSEDFGGARLNAILESKDRTFAEIDGTIYTRQDSLDLQLRMDELPLKWTEPFLTGVLNKASGSISTNLMIEGSSKAPQTRGFIGFNDAQIGIDYTNVLYTISDTISVSPDRIGFDNLIIKDSKGNTANVNATITHKNFYDIKYALNMRMNNLLVLNTEHRTDSLFYGVVYASGTIGIKGDNNGINMDMQIRNDKNSKLNILLPQHSEASDYKSVVYINVPQEKVEEALKNAIQKKNDSPLPLKLKVALTVTPDLLMGIVINPATGDEMQAKGNGAINFNYDMLSENMSVYGDYTLTDGYVKLNLQNLKKLQFAIQDGSKLYLSGDPLKTRFDITAYRRVRPELRTLDASLSGEGYPSKVDVDCILGIKGNINKMDVSYSINLSDGNDDVRTRVNSYISTDEQKTLQFASLVATGSFYSNSGSSGANFGSTLWTSLASSTLSSGLTSLVGNMLGDEWQIGANLESNDGTLSDMNMSVNVSRKFLDDKLLIKTNVGYRNDQSTSGNSLIGDFDADYQLNSVWTLRAYSHTNDRYYRQAPTTQGLGIVYNKEAPTLKRLFQSFKPRRRLRPLQQETPLLPTDSISTVIKPIITDKEGGKADAEVKKE